MICSCNLRFWLKIFQSSANFLEESCISRALWALALSPQAFNQGPGPGPGLSHSPNVGPRALQKGLGPDPSLLNLKILEKLTESLFVLFASCQCLVSSTWRRTHNKHSQNFFKNFKDWYFISAKNFKEMVKTKNDQHKILDNFYVECFHIENIMSYIR